MSSVTLKSLTLRNFLSYGNEDTTINLDFKKAILIKGRNLDASVEGQVDSNGAGKSAILDAISYALYGKTISGRDATKLINVINKKNLAVTLTFEKGGKLYQIIRSRKSKTKGDIAYYVDGVDLTNAGIGDVNRKIVEVMGMDYDVFSRVVVFSAMFKPFLDLPSRHATQANQTGIIESLFGQTELSEKAEILKSKIKGVKAEFKHLEELQEQISKEMVRHTEQIELATSRIESWATSQKRKISDAEEEVYTLAKIDTDAEKAKLAIIEGYEAEILEARTAYKLAQMEHDNLSEKVEAFKTKTLKVNKLTKSIKQVEDGVDFDKEEALLVALVVAEEESITHRDAAKHYSALCSDAEKCITVNDKEIGHLADDTCPYCKQDFADSKSKLKALNEENADYTNELDTNTELAADAGALLMEANKQVEEIKSNTMFASQVELVATKEKYESLKTQLDEMTLDDLDTNIVDMVASKDKECIALQESGKKLKAQLNDATDATEFSSVTEVERITMELEVNKDKVKSLLLEDNPHLEALEDLEKVTFDEDKSKTLNELSDTLRHQEFLLKLLTKKDSFIRKALLDQSLPFLNKRLMHYLSQLGLPHRVEFQPDMSANITQFGSELEFSMLSSGQRARVNIALSFAFRDVLQARHGKISFCLLDECLDTGLGNAGVQFAAKMIKKIAVDNDMSMFIISHRDEIANMFDDTITVELKNGFSNIVYGEE